MGNFIWLVLVVVGVGLLFYYRIPQQLLVAMKAILKQLGAVIGYGG